MDWISAGDGSSDGGGAGCAGCLVCGAFWLFVSVRGLVLLFGSSRSEKTQRRLDSVV